LQTILLVFEKKKSRALFESSFPSVLAGAAYFPAFFAGFFLAFAKISPWLLRYLD
jgi:hypothetical protein